LPIQIPKIRVEKQSNIDNPRFAIPACQFPDLRRCTVSKLKVEKVVKDPQNPTIIKLFAIAISVLESNDWIRTQNTKDPTAFTNKVANGK
jgi:hypothetical protein